ncbi:MAG: alpha-L-fucosidase [Bacteroidales bacterium]|nr:alpha-L-fucosidase [Bacteroidales bacterium]
MIKIQRLTVLAIIPFVLSWGCDSQAKKEKLASTDVVVNEVKKIPPKMDWFREAKLGIFIHWGIYAVDGTAESWAFFNNEVPYDEYMSQAKGFTASKYDAEAWAELFKKAGAKYAVLTSKHHDGVALWDTKLSDLNVVDKTPAGRDLLTPYAEALREEGLKVGLYFSHLDWSHPDYASVIQPGMEDNENRNLFAYPAKGKEDPEAWERFLEFHRGQIREIMDLFHPDLYWFDGDWERTDEQWRMKEVREMILSEYPDAILNARMKGHGDYETPEQGVPINPPDGVWELCMTINDSWGFRYSDTNFKSPRQVMQTFAECIGTGGNLLLDIGPREDGTIPLEQVEVLTELGKWIDKHEEAVYPTEKGLPYGHFYGPTTLNKTKDVIYLYILGQPKAYVTLKGVRNNINNIRVVGSNRELDFKRFGGAEWQNIPGILYINVPENVIDKYITVLAVELDGKLDLYHN